MKNNSKKKSDNGNFHISKWYLDFISESQEVFIIYAAKLSWRGLTVPYNSILHYISDNDLRQKSRFKNAVMPEKKEDCISWSDSIFNIEGRWEALADPIEERLFQSPKRYLDWKCFQPASKVHLKTGDRTLKGSGYAEQLVMTLFPWKIPLHELRWGRFGAKDTQLVWIELGNNYKQKWMWRNGEKIKKCTIKDDCLYLPEHNCILEMDQKVILESERPIFSVVKNMTKYLPGFNSIIPLNFLMAEGIKWFSKVRLTTDDNRVIDGKAIHEFVNFKNRL